MVEAEEDSQKTANLARIRDNQRRSRARRKDYLKELETRYRNCEQVGVSASTELQAAARRVVEENRRLRDLLKAYGVSDAEIDNASGSQGSIEADSLDVLANKRQPCGPGDGCEVTTPMSAQSQQSQHLQPAPYVPIQPACQPTCQPMPQATSAGLHPIIPAQQFPSQTISPMILPGRKESLDSTQSPSTLGPAHQFSQAYVMPVGHQALFPNGYHEPQMPQVNNQYSGLSSCQVAANNIRTFSPNAGYELEQELGCRVPGEDCSVNNMRLFDVIDRYTGKS